MLKRTRTSTTIYRLRAMKKFVDSNNCRIPFCLDDLKWHKRSTFGYRMPHSSHPDCYLNSAQCDLFFADKPAVVTIGMKQVAQNFLQRKNRIFMVSRRTEFFVDNARTVQLSYAYAEDSHLDYEEKEKIMTVFLSMQLNDVARLPKREDFEFVRLAICTGDIILHYVSEELLSRFATIIVTDETRDRDVLCDFIDCFSILTGHVYRTLYAPTDKLYN